MANLKEIRNRIVSVTANMKITQAMKMVSAAKFRKASDAIIRMRPYSDALKGILAEAAASLSEETSAVESPYTVVRPVKKMLVVVYTSNKGLCGAFNANVVKKAKAYMRKNLGVDFDLMTIGTKGHDILKKTYTIAETYSQLYDNPSFEKSNELAEQIMARFVAGNYDKVVLVYNKLKNAATQIPTVEEFLPLEIDLASGASASGVEYILEPDSETIIRDLMPQSLKLQFYKVLRDTIAAENGARMTAMSQATDNAKTLKEKLTLYYNKERQAAITNQIIEIATGAEALS